MFRMKSMPGLLSSFGQRTEPDAPTSPGTTAWTPSHRGCSEDRRQHERVQVTVRASAYCHGRHQPIFIRDVSCGGLMMANAFGLAIGDVVTVTTLTGERYHGRVAWSVAPYTGMKFDNRIDETDPIFTRRDRPVAGRTVLA